MEHKDKHNDILDTVIADSLRDHYGPPPSRAVWGRILNEITTPTELPVQERRWEWWRNWFRGPVARTAFIFTVLLILVGRPAVAEYNRVVTRATYSDVDVVVPTVPQQRPVPAADLRSNARPASSQQIIAEARSIGVPVSQLESAETP